MSHYDDEQQAEAVKKWFLENWLALVAGLAIGLGAIFGWQGWQSMKQEKSTEASRMYEEARQALDSGDIEEASALAAKLSDDYSGTPYDDQAALLLARYHVDQGELPAAAEQLRSVVDGNADEPLKQVARLRLARVLWAQDQTEEALAELDAGGSGEFVSLFEELRGDIMLTQGDRAAARQAYQKVIEAGNEAAANRELLQQKLDDLADVVNS